VTRSSNGPYYYGDMVQIMADPTSDYEFNQWDGAVSGSLNPKQVTITKNTYITAYFKEKDSDNDGLTDIEENRIGSNPYDSDTDDDGIPDGTDLWPTKDAKVRVNITGFTQLSYCDPLSDWGEPYCIIKVDGLSQVQLSGSTGAVDFNIPDNVRYVSVHVEAWDSDPTSADDPYDISSEAGVNDIDVTFDRESSPSTVTGDGSEDGNLNDACQATIRIQITNY
jgi:hypothetical protein